MRPIAQQGTSLQYFGPDALGSVRQLYDGSGQILASTRYDPYGTVLSQNGTATSIYGFTGEQLDASTGLEYLRARFYDPYLNHWIQPDPIISDYANPQSLNRYTYVLDNPVNYTDPSGLDPWWCDSQPKPQKCRDDYYKQVMSRPPFSQPGSASTPTATGSGKTAYLTFDDGPDPAGYTTQIALALQAQGAQATLFVTGKDPGQTSTRVLQTCDPKIAPQGITWDRLHVVNLMQGLGHAVGIHGWIHTNLWDQQGTDPANEVKQVVDALEGISVHPDHLLRAPGGQWPAKGIKGYEGWYWYGWDLPPAMIDPNGADAATIKQRFSKALDDAGYPDNPIILLHSPRARTADAILDLLRILRSKGYAQFKSLKEPRPGDTPGHPIGKYGIGAR